MSARAGSEVPNLRMFTGRRSDAVNKYIAGKLEVGFERFRGRDMGTRLYNYNYYFRVGICMRL